MKKLQYRPIDIEKVTEKTIKVFLNCFKLYGGYDGIYDDVLSVLIGIRDLSRSISVKDITPEQATRDLINEFKVLQRLTVGSTSTIKNEFLTDFSISMKMYLYKEFTYYPKK